VGRPRFFGDPAAAARPLRACATPTGQDSFDCMVVDASGRVIARLDGYRTVVLPTAIPEAVAADLHATFRT